MSTFAARATASTIVASLGTPAPSSSNSPASARPRLIRNAPVFAAPTAVVAGPKEGSSAAAKQPSIDSPSSSLLQNQKPTHPPPPPPSKGMDAVERLKSGFEQFKADVYDSKKPELFEPLKAGQAPRKQEKYKNVQPTAIDLFKECHCSSKTGFTEPVKKAIADMEAIMAEPVEEGQVPKYATEGLLIHDEMAVVSGLDL